MIEYDRDTHWYAVTLHGTLIAYAATMHAGDIVLQEWTKNGYLQH